MAERNQSGTVRTRRADVKVPAARRRAIKRMAVAEASAAGEARNAARATGQPVPESDRKQPPAQKRKRSAAGKVNVPPQTLMPGSGNRRVR